jgi:hypothetical protein
LKGALARAVVAAPRGPFLAFAIAMLTVDLGFLAGHVLFKLGRLGDGWSVTYDRSYSEYFAYGQEAFLALLFAAAFALRRQPVHGALVAVFVAFVADDYAGLHERAGQEGGASIAIDLPGATAGKDVVEFAALLAAALVGLALLFAAMRWSDRSSRADGIGALSGLTAIFLFAGVGDLAHSLVHSNIAGVVEDEGELLALSVLTASLAGRLVPTLVEAAGPRREPAAPLPLVSTGASADRAGRG